MKLLIVAPGADWSTIDVHNGLVASLRRRGHEVLDYPLSQRIERSASWLRHCWEAARCHDPTADVPEPTFADTLYLAGERVLPLALRAQVDWVLVVSGMYFHPDHLILLKRAGVCVALLLTETPYDQEQEARILPHVTLAWTNERSSVPFLRTANPNVHYLPHAYDPTVHRPNTIRSCPPAAAVGQHVREDSSLPALTNATAGLRPTGHPANRQSSGSLAPKATGVPGNGERSAHDQYSPALSAHDVVFVGTAFQERIETLEAVDWAGMGIDLGLYGNWTEALPEGHALLPYVRAETVPNAVAAALYRRAKVGLNLYRTSKGFGPDAPRIAHAESLNPRALELAATGTFHLSDQRAEVGEVFGSLVPTFTTPAELTALLRHWLPRPTERSAIAAQLPGAVEWRSFDAMAASVEGDLARAAVRLPIGAGAA